MSQWIPKTAWKVSNLNKRYGQQYIPKGYPVAQGGELLSSSHTSLYDERALKKECVGENFMTTLKVSDANLLSEATIIDLREHSVSQREPLGLPSVLVLHLHDLLSGAALPLLPERKAQSELFLVAPNTHRAMNGAIGMRRWGYSNVSIVNAATISNPIKDIESNRKEH
ncbi:unnamed protein product [Phytomonas sp. EM1]|nr:unnamed protein product [Phytomonas sp. EM1]|eukprot:CCW65832.1 unnamed protein product [Phytomonas sp. isolate EM1]